MSLRSTLPGKDVLQQVLNYSSDELDDSRDSNYEPEPNLVRNSYESSNESVCDADLAENDTDLTVNDADLAESGTDSTVNYAAFATNDTDLTANDADLAENDTYLTVNDADLAENDTYLTVYDADLAENGTDMTVNDAGVNHPDCTRGSRKRKETVSSWKRNIKKQNVNSGVSYTTNSGKIVNARKLGLMQCKCNYGCHEKLDTAEQQAIFDKYWIDFGGDRARQRSFIAVYTESQAKKSNKREKTRRAKDLFILFSKK
jgi:hypothetical protein